MTALGESLTEGRHDMAERIRIARDDLEAKTRAREEARAHLAELEQALLALTLQAKRAQRPRYYQMGEPPR